MMMQHKMAQDTNAIEIRLNDHTLNHETLISPAELHELQQCQKLVRFRDEILAGLHPRIKPPAHLGANGKTPAATQTSASATQATNGSNSAAKSKALHVAGNLRNLQAEFPGTAVTMGSAVPGLGFLGGVANGASGSASKGIKRKREIDSMLPRAPDRFNGVKAEVQLQRQKLEQKLKDEASHSRASSKPLQGSQATSSFSSYVDMDVSEAYERAMALVHPTAASAAVAAQANNNTAAIVSTPSQGSMSTFYSSSVYSHTTELARQPHVSNEPDDEDDYEPTLDPDPVVSNPVEHCSLVRQATTSAAYGQETSGSTLVPQNVCGGGVPGLPSTPYYMGPTGIGAVTDLNVGGRGTSQDLNTRAASGRASPVVRAHNLSLIAPQPAHVPFLGVARRPARWARPDVSHAPAESRHDATPAQVAVFANASSSSSRDSDSQPSQVKKQSAKKRRADLRAERRAAKRAARATGQALAAPALIKAEPRSPSPLNASVYGRPLKRQKRTPRQHGGPGTSQFGGVVRQPIIFDEDHGQRRYESRGRFGDEQRLPRAGNGYLDHPDSRGSRPQEHVPPPARCERVRNCYNAASPIGPRSGAGAGDGRVDPRSVSYAYEGRPLGHLRNYPGRVADGDGARSPVTYSRASTAMPPPARAPPARFLVDEYGREYLDPVARPGRIETVIRTEMLGPDGVQYIYKRPQAQRQSDFMREDGFVCRASMAPPPRRVVTESDVSGPPDYRVYREGDYGSFTARPLGPPMVDDALYRGNVAAERSYMPPAMDSAASERFMRAASLRPASHADAAVRYEDDDRYGDAVRARASTVRPGGDGLFRVERPVGFERHVVVDERDQAIARAATVRPAGGAEPFHYQYASAYAPARVGSVAPSREAGVAPAPHGRAYSVRPTEVAYMAAPTFAPPPPDRYGAGAAYMHGRGHGQRDDVDCMDWTSHGGASQA